MEGEHDVAERWAEEEHARRKRAGSRNSAGQSARIQHDGLLFWWRGDTRRVAHSILAVVLSDSLGVGAFVVDMVAFTRAWRPVACATGKDRELEPTCFL